MSKHGTTEKVARRIAEKQPDTPVELINLRENKNPDIEDFDTVIIGGSIHAGTIQKRVTNFCKNNIELLLKKRTGLFLCCMMKEKGDEQFKAVFPGQLRNHAVANTCVGGEFLFEKMNFLERAIVKKAAQTEKSVSKLDETAIADFVGQLF